MIFKTLMVLKLLLLNYSIDKVVNSIKINDFYKTIRQ
jgi:hypothetical protein